MIEHLEWLCSPDGAQRGGLLAGLFLVGAAGSAIHCGPMCGVFVLGQVSERMAGLPASALCEWRRLSTALLLPYHLGRLTTYAFLGALASGPVAVLAAHGWLRPLSSALLAAAALLFAGHALRLLAPTGNPGAWGRLIARITRRIGRGSAGGGFLLGVTLGFLPCGFLYAALVSAASLGNPLQGALAMMLFGLGTVPALVVVGVAGQVAGRQWRTAVRTAAPIVMAVNAAVLLVLAWRGIA